MSSKTSTHSYIITMNHDGAAPGHKVQHSVVDVAEPRAEILGSASFLQFRDKEGDLVLSVPAHAILSIARIPPAAGI